MLDYTQPGLRKENTNLLYRKGKENGSKNRKQVLIAETLSLEWWSCLEGCEAEDSVCAFDCPASLCRPGDLTRSFL